MRDKPLPAGEDVKLSEFQVISRYFERAPKTALLGVGDDCALLRVPPGLALAVSCDMLVEGVHFFPDVDAASLGHKALAVNLSDLAAMGAEARWAMLALALPAVDRRWLEEFSRGFFALADRYRLDLVGGDTTRGALNICITVLGLSPPGLALRRDGARPGDEIWLSGRTGEAALAIAAKRGEVQLAPADLQACRQRLEWPEPRLDLGQALRGIANSAIDISDGLVQDLGHICERSKVAVEITLNSLPVAPSVAACGTLGVQAMLAGGDDYELCVTAPAGQSEAMAAIGARLGVRITRIGRVSSGAPGVTVLDREGKAMVLARSGFDHFA